MDEWARWTLGIAFVLCSGTVAWLARRLASVETKVTILETRPHINPMDYVENITRLTAAIDRLTERIESLEQVERKLAARQGV